LRVKNGNVRSIVFKQGVDGFRSPRPNFPLMRKRVRVALGEAKRDEPSSSRPATPSSQSPSKSPTADKPKPSNAESEDLKDSCAWKPGIAATAKPPR
jgi:hypothetical protein